MACASGGNFNGPGASRMLQATGMPSVILAPAAKVMRPFTTRAWRTLATLAHLIIISRRRSGSPALKSPRLSAKRTRRGGQSLRVGL
jgi:hypothetical protein